MYGREGLGVVRGCGDVGTGDMTASSYGLCRHA